MCAVEFEYVWAATLRWLLRALTLQQTFLLAVHILYNNRQ